MQLRRRDYLKLGSASVLAGLAATRPARAAEFTLRLASVAAATSPSHKEGIVAFARGVERDSDGVIEIAEKATGGYGKPAEVFAMVERGDVEMGYVPQGYSPGRFNQTSVMELPLMFANAPAGSAALNGLFKQGLLDRDYATVKVLGLHVMPPYGLFTSGKIVSQLRDMRGLRVRAGSLTMALALSRLGMLPIGAPLDLIGELLSSGTLDAITFGWDPMLKTPGAGGKMLAEQLKVLVDANLAAPAIMLVMNRQAWDSLPPDLQGVLERQGQAFSRNVPHVLQKREDEARAQLRSDAAHTYVGVNAEMRAEIAQSLEPVVSRWNASTAKRGVDAAALLAAATAEVKAYQPTAA